MSTEDTDFSIRSLARLKRKFGTNSVSDDPNQKETLTAVVGVVKRFEQEVSKGEKYSIWKRIRRPLSGWYIAGSVRQKGGRITNDMCRKLSTQQRRYIKFHKKAFDIMLLDEKQRNFLLLLAYAELPPLPQDHFTFLFDQFRVYVDDCTSARNLLSKYFKDDKLLKEVFLEPKRKLLSTTAS